MTFAWAATPEQVATLMVDRLDPSGGRFTDQTTPTLDQVQALLDLLAVKVLVQVGDRTFAIPEPLWPLAQLAHAQLVAAHAENQYGEQVEQTSRAVFLNIAAKDTMSLLTEQVKAWWRGGGGYASGG